MVEYREPDLLKAEALPSPWVRHGCCAQRTALHLRGQRRGGRRGADSAAARARSSSGRPLWPDEQFGSMRRWPTHRDQRSARCLARGGVSVEWSDPSGLAVARRVGHPPARGTAHRENGPHGVNSAHTKVRGPTRCSARRGCPPLCSGSDTSCVQTPKYIEALNWYLDTVGSDRQPRPLLPRQRERGPILRFIRCDRRLRPPPITNPWPWRWDPVKRLYALRLRGRQDLDALAAGGNTCGTKGISRRGGHRPQIEGSQIFEYWRARTVSWCEHYAMGQFDNTRSPVRPRCMPPGLISGDRRRARTSWGRITARSGERTRRDGRRPASRQRMRPVRAARAVAVSNS